MICLIKELYLIFKIHQPMKKLIYLFVVALLIISCTIKPPPLKFKKYDESAELVEQQKHSRKTMQFKLMQSKYLDLNDVFAPFNKDLSSFSEDEYNALKPMILERDIPTLQAHVANRDLSYEKLTLFYLYRIRKFESDSTKSLNSIIALNPNVLKEARQKDKEKNKVLNILYSECQFY